VVVHNLKLGGKFSWAVAVDWDQVLLQLIPGGLKELAVLLDFSSDLAKIIEEFVTETGNFEAWAHERVSNLGYSVLDHLTVLEDNHVSNFWFAVLDKRLFSKMGQSLTAGCTEKHPCHSHGLITIVDGTSNERNVDSSSSK
jgi:hypothetical protein